MRMYDLIKKKRDGGALSEEEINHLVKGATSGEIPDYQISAFLMAVYFKGLDYAETEALTFAVADSGSRLDLSGVAGFKADKHSTGGVGDKTSLVALPIAAACGLKIAKMSGRGLGHTGGTVDKLEAIRGYKTDISGTRFIEIANSVGLCITGQSGELAPADKKLYAIRDVTATVDNPALIAVSIMGKKLAAGDDGIVLDVKTGSGSFNKTLEAAEELAALMVKIGKAAGKKCVALITDMDKPLGSAIGNSLEVIEAIETLKGSGPDDLRELSLALAAEMLFLSGVAREKCRPLAELRLADGSALKKFRDSVAAHGGDTAFIDDPSLFPRARINREIRSDKEGYITAMDAEGYGRASLALGAGRAVKDARIDLAAGITVLKKTGDLVKSGEPVAILHTEKEESLIEAEKILLGSFATGAEAPEPRSLVLGRIE